MLILITEITSKIPLSKIYIKKPYIYQIILYYVLIFGIRYLTKTEKLKKILKNKKKVIVVILIIALLPDLICILPSKDLKLYFIDVGQGDSSLIITPQNKRILIDGGGNENLDVGEKVLLPYLLNRRIKYIDYMIISHFDTDHCRTDY